MLSKYFMQVSIHCLISSPVTNHNNKCGYQGKVEFSISVVGIRQKKKSTFFPPVGWIGVASSDQQNFLWVQNLEWESGQIAVMNSERLWLLISIEEIDEATFPCCFISV